MKILFDHQIFSMQKYGGISRYFANLHFGLNQLADVESNIPVLYSENEYIKPNAVLKNSGLGSKLFSGHANRTYRWNQRFSRLNLKLKQYDLIHPTFYDPYFTEASNKKFVLTVHDMIHELHTDLFKHNPHEIIARKKYLIARAAAVIAISEHTKQDIIKLYPEWEKKITVVHHGYHLTPKSVNSSLSLPQHYILYVGDRWHYKNFPLLVNAIGSLLKCNPGLQLLCAGGGSFNAEELALFNNLDIAPQCRQMSVTDDGLMQLYQQAQLFVFPSLQEGFGLPVLEAFANNCPVVCSNTTSLPEVAGKAAVYFDPLSMAGIKQAVEQVLANKTLQQELKHQGQQQLALFTFDKCVQNTLKVYQSVL